MVMEPSKLHAVPPSHGDGDEFELESDTCPTLGAINVALTMLAAINHGELLSALPEDPADRVRHQTAVSMLGIAENALRQAIGNPDHLISDECRCNGKGHCGPRFR
jgi:hypothetical protein